MGADSATLFTLGWFVACTVLCLAVCLARPQVLEQAAARLPRWLPLWAAIFAVALVVRLVPAVVLKLQSGALVTWDLDSYRIVGQLLRSGQDVYSEPARHPYLPFEMYLIGAASWLSAHAAWPFELIVKLPQILADAAVAVVLLFWTQSDGSRQRSLWAAAVYALNPVTMVVVSIHGQFDSIPLLFTLAALLPLRRKPASMEMALVCGALLGMGVLAKTWPVMLVPIAAWQLPRWSQRGAFACAVGAVPLAGLALYCAVIGVWPDSAIHAARIYNGFPGVYGYPLLLAKATSRELMHAADVEAWTQSHGRLILAAALLGATALALRKPLATAVAMVMLAFYVFTPGWGYHYLVWGMPFLLLGLPRKASSAFVAVAAMTMFGVYYWYGGVYGAVFNYFETTSAIVRWRWLLPVPIWALAAALLAVMAWRSEFWSEAARRLPHVSVPVHRPRRASAH